MGSSVLRREGRAVAVGLRAEVRGSVWIWAGGGRETPGLSMETRAMGGLGSLPLRVGEARGCEVS